MDSIPIDPLLVRASCSLVLAIVAAVSQKTEAPAEDSVLSQPRNEQVESDAGPLFCACSLVGREVRTSDGIAVGNIADLVFDLDEGRISLVVLQPNAEQGSKRVLVPMAALAKLSIKADEGVTVGVPVQKMAGAMSLDDKSGSVTRTHVAKAYAHFGEPVYWKESARADQAPLPMASGLRDTPVANARGTRVGTIRDFAVNSKGQVAYAGLEMTDNADRLYPVPLSAFIVSSPMKNWTIELPKDILENTPTFPAKQWPKTIDRGWSEYVHVRYGASPFGGVNRKAGKAVTPREAPKED